MKQRAVAANTVSAWEEDLTHLKELAEKGGDEGKKSIATLVHYANDFTLNHEDPKALYAVMMLHDLGVSQEEPSSTEVQHVEAPPPPRSR